MAATDQLQNFLWAQNSTKSQKLFKFYNHIPHDTEICRSYFHGLLKLKMAATDQLHIFCGRKIKNSRLVAFIDFNMPDIW